MHLKAERLTAAHPWAILAAGAAIQLLTGLPAAWGVFQQPVREAYALGEMGATAAFSALIAAYGLGCVLGGFLQDKRGPRCAALWGTALLEAGLWGAVFLPARAGWAAALVFSVPAGLGTAFLYPAIQSCAQKWYQAIGAQSGLPQYYTYSATNFRLQELSLGYTLPAKWFRDKMRMTVSFVGRNLWMIYCKAPFDPEAVASTGLNYQGIDYFMMPSLRSLGFNVKFQF